MIFENHRKTMNFKYIHIVIFNTSHTMPSLRKRRQLSCKDTQQKHYKQVLPSEN